MTGNGPDRSPTAPGASVNGFAVASLVLGISWLMWLGSILALVFGYTAMNQINRSPGTQTGRGLAIAGITLGWVGVATLVLMLTMSMTGNLNMPDMPMMNRPGNAELSSNGERIYITARNDDGETITYEGGPGDGMMSGRLACVDCHGAEGRGGERQMMMETFYPPDIRWSTLTGDHDDHDNRGEEGEAPTRYTPETLRGAVSDGVGSAGQPLTPIMPRWQLSDEDFDDLVEYLRTLDGESRSG